jgi:hypothetical protein
MNKKLVAVLVLGLTAGVVGAATDVRGGMCYSPNALLAGGNSFFNCDHIGRVKDIKEIYERGFRVLSSNFVPKEAGGGISTGLMLVIEERR